MNTQQRERSPHPSVEELSGYGCDPLSPRYAHVEAHMASCAVCRREAARARQLAEGVRALGTIGEKVEVGAHLGKEQIAAYIGGERVAQRQQWQAHIEQCGECRRAVLLQRARGHAQANVATISSGERSSIANGGAKENNVTWLGRRIPVWGALPVALAAGLLMAVGLQRFDADDRISSIVTAYQDDPTVVYTSPSSAPGLGFFSNAGERAEPFSGVAVQLRGEHVILTWAPLANVAEYEMRIALVEAGDAQSVVVQERIRTTTLQMDAAKFVSGRRYVWSLSGERENGEHFGAKGGFVVAR